MSSDIAPRLIVCSGEPAGIGPELVLKLASNTLDVRLACSADPELLTSVAANLTLDVSIRIISPDEPIPPHTAGTLSVLPCQTAQVVTPGVLNPANAPYVIECLDVAIAACQAGRADAMITAPLQKSIINDAGIPFSGHTEYLAARTAPTIKPIMLLASENLRIALVTTHLSLRQVPSKISVESVRHTIDTVATSLRRYFGIPNPMIAVCGLNPHAGENGHFGTEEIDLIRPAIEAARSDSAQIVGPIPADTAFTPSNREKYDCFISMFHDQGLPVIKALEFGEIVNVTLGLPIIRTSVDHGTALDISGQGIADPSSLLAAVNLAKQLALTNSS